jgi:adenosylmethionine---8-amino-7-oxononanoate aminotransferase
MARSNKRSLAKLDQKYVWHPFTQMRDWAKIDPTVIVSGKGPYLIDESGNKYLDANASIWTNLHGHQHSRINRAIQKQLRKIAHSSALGLANEPASILARKLVEKAPKSLKKVFYSDDGSTAIEVALKMAFQYWKHRGKKRNRYLSLENSYHGDTVGAMSLGGIDVFHGTYKDLMFQTDKAPAPYCYRCPYNRAKPERADARSYRKCNFECASLVEKKISNNKQAYAAAVIEPLVQGAAGMIAHPTGYLKLFAQICRSHDIPLIADEVMTGFGRTGTMFACEQENVSPDFLCLSKGITGGYLPLGATLTSQRIFNAFLGDYAERKTFFHGHSYTGNQLGCSAALANLEIFEKEKTLMKNQALAKRFDLSLQEFWRLEHVGDIRRVGMIAGIELVHDWKTRTAYSWKEKIGVRVCEEAKKNGVITRPVGNVIVIMPPYCVNESQLQTMGEVLKRSIQKITKSS